jgi:hypothetical protein
MRVDCSMDVHNQSCAALFVQIECVENSWDDEGVPSALVRQKGNRLIKHLELSLE